jgi:UDP:flavonoid glycosyltransferase YjiC (YdhE family)
VPLVAIPLHAEQELNVALVERLGAARHVTPGTAGAAEIASVADAVLADRACRDAAESIRQIYDRVDGPGNAADAIAGLARTA